MSGRCNGFTARALKLASIVQPSHREAVRNSCIRCKRIRHQPPAPFRLPFNGLARSELRRIFCSGEGGAHEANHDVYPVDTARLRRVTELVAQKAGWGKKLPPGHGLGIAAHRSFVSYIATVVEVAVDNKGNLTVPQVDTAIDCGFYANPERIRSQIEGAAVMGLSLAKYGEITPKNGRVEQSNFNDYPVVRHDESPAVTNTHIVENSIDVPSSGVGEPGVPPFAPALCNAIFAATGKRIRRLPIGNQLA